MSAFPRLRYDLPVAVGLGARSMAWLTIRTGSGFWKVKPRWQARWAERTGKVRVIDLGIVLVTWWSNEDLDRYR